MIKYLTKFLFIIDKQKPRLIILVCLFLFTSLLDTVGIGLIGPFIALANNPNTIHTVHWLSWLYSSIGLFPESRFISLFGLCIVFIFYVKSYLTFRVQRYVFKFVYFQKGELSKRLLKGYLAAPYTFHLNRNTALLIQNILQETNNFCNGIMQPLLNSIAYLVIILFLGFLLLKTDLIATVLIIFILLFPLLIYNGYKNQLAQWGKNASIAQVGIIRTINHSLGGLKETKVIGCESYFEDQISLHIKDFENAVSESQTFKLLPRILIEAILITFLVGFTSIYLFSQRDTQNLASVLGVFAIASIRLIPAASQLTNSIASLKNYSFSLNKLYYDLKEIEQVKLTQLLEQSYNQSNHQQPSTEASKQIAPFNHEITLESIAYSYPNVSELAIDNISLTIFRGESIGLIGKSGAGKTTLVDVLLGLLQIKAGDIKVDGVSIYQDLRSWQNLIGYIPQSIFLMDDTIQRNIAFGVPDQLIDRDRLAQAVIAAQLNELISELPAGLDTIVGEKGVRLSGGQRQRVGIARALYHEREILILDEATAALDNETERLVNESIQALSGIKTLIIIAHRLTTVEHCDRLYLLKRGRVVKSGSYCDVVLNENSTQ